MQRSWGEVVGLVVVMGGIVLAIDKYRTMREEQRKLEKSRLMARRLSSMLPRWALN